MPATIEPALSDEEWHEALLSQSGFGILLLDVATLAAADASGHVAVELSAAQLAAVEDAPCSRPPWLKTARELPFCLQNERFVRIPWDNSSSAHDEPLPHLVLGPYAAQGAEHCLRKLHATCVEQGAALVSYCSLTTPSLEWKVLLIPSHFGPTQEDENDIPGAAAGASSGAGRAPCFHLYFMPYNPKVDGSLDGSGGTPGVMAAAAAAEGAAAADAAAPVLPLAKSWWRRRLQGVDASGARRSDRLATQAQLHLRDEPDVATWRQENRMLDREPASGLPRAEAEQLRFCGTSWDPATSSYASSPGLGCCGRPLPRTHISSVASVVPGTRFIYSIRPLMENVPEEAETGGGSPSTSTSGGGGGGGGGEGRARPDDAGRGGDEMVLRRSRPAGQAPWYVAGDPLISGPGRSAAGDRGPGSAAPSAGRPHKAPRPGRSTAAQSAATAGAGSTGGAASSGSSCYDHVPDRAAGLMAHHQLTPVDDDVAAPVAFLQECRCKDGGCAGLRARQALRAMRQDGCPFRLEIFPCRHGLGVRAAEFIPEGAFVTEYVGVWRRVAESHRLERGPYQRHRLHYTFNVLPKWELRPQEKAEARLVCDATHFGNVSRFINHSCAPNLVARNVCNGEGTARPEMPIVFQALRDIQRGEELTLA